MQQVHLAMEVLEGGAELQCVLLDLRLHERRRLLLALVDQPPEVAASRILHQDADQAVELKRRVVAHNVLVRDVLEDGDLLLRRTHLRLRQSFGVHLLHNERLAALFRVPHQEHRAERALAHEAKLCEWASDSGRRARRRRRRY
jgi:hypothetical protein